MKNIEYYNTRIEALKVTIRRLTAEKRIAILRERERTLKSQMKIGITSGQKLQLRQGGNIRAAFIEAVAIILVPFIGWFLNYHSNKKGAPLQKNVSISSEAETKGNQSPIVVTSGPNSPVNIYISPGQ